MGQTRNFAEIYHVKILPSQYTLSHRPSILLKYDKTEQKAQQNIFLKLC